MKKEKKGFYHIIASTKGGVGKTEIAQQIVSSYLFNKSNEKIQILEVDDNNESSCNLKKSNICEIKSFNVNIGSDEAQKKLFDVIDSKDVVIDAGGGNDSLILIDSILDMGMSDYCIFYIPLCVFFYGLNWISNWLI